MSGPPSPAAVGSASSALEATSARAAKAARHLPDFERTPLREVFSMSTEICEDDL